MVKNLVPITLHTVESSFVSTFCKHHTDVPYQRVLGVSIGEGMPISYWTPSGTGGDRLEYTQSDTEELRYFTTETMADRLGAFFNRFYVEGPKRDPDEATNQLSEYYETNCHRFAYWMKGVLMAEADDVPMAPDHIVGEGIAARPPFPMGYHAVIGRHAAVHSVSGMGMDTEQCMQVLATSGPLGVSTYEAVMADYDADGSRGYAYYV